MGMKTAIAVAVALIAYALSARAADSIAPTRVLLGIDADPQHLVEAARSLGYAADIDAEAGDQEASDAQGVWIGREVPFQAAKQIVLLALSKYPHLRYYTYFGDADQDIPADWKRTVFVGGSIFAACKNTRAVAR